jgi:hypothetical protein
MTEAKRRASGIVTPGLSVRYTFRYPHHVWRESELELYRSNLGADWVTWRGHSYQTRKWLEQIASTNVPVIDLSHFLPTRFGERDVSVSNLLNRYFGNISRRRQETLDDITRALRTWRKSDNKAAFDELFARLKERVVDEQITLPLMMSSLAESYPVARQLPSRSAFRQWLVTQCEGVLGPERARRIFDRFV